MEQEVKQTPQEELEKIMSQLLSHCSPTTDEELVSMWWSTDMIISSINSISGKTFTRKQVYEYMLDKGYRLGMIPGSITPVFHWMIEEVRDGKE